MIKLLVFYLYILLGLGFVIRLCKNKLLPFELRLMKWAFPETEPQQKYNTIIKQNRNGEITEIYKKPI